ncbi:predicted protein [Chaetomium globosum CBS 148.51]|uniref:Uncharacterized protein n=1 Tax=Chaetomium globosum (strain ATCC 6205 / CBS 148.51 / DSM 1962 / NBRC 6347 / NRRL 1970) TaxID=306901 RepID=Q2H345_CHAGB|nr:uncharacterized protein CHGG_03801 [Chaetomium globosum CBS 148.51]EAQ87182.1 predicted protein [Chaetomium globosum CBS 148.51]
MEDMGIRARVIQKAVVRIVRDDAARLQVRCGKSTGTLASSSDSLTMAANAVSPSLIPPPAAVSSFPGCIFLPIDRRWSQYFLPSEVIVQAMRCAPKESTSKSWLPPPLFMLKFFEQMLPFRSQHAHWLTGPAQFLDFAFSLGPRDCVIDEPRSSVKEVSSVNWGLKLQHPTFPVDCPQPVLDISAILSEDNNRKKLQQASEILGVSVSDLVAFSSHRRRDHAEQRSQTPPGNDQDRMCVNPKAPSTSQINQLNSLPSCQVQAPAGYDFNWAQLQGNEPGHWLARLYLHRCLDLQSPPAQPQIPQFSAR